MEAASRGAAGAGGVVIGIVPSESPGEANPHCTHVVATGIGHARNLAVVASGEAAIAIGGEWGTLAEIGFARRLGRPVVALGSWEMTGPATMAGAAGGDHGRADPERGAVRARSDAALGRERQLGPQLVACDGHGGRQRRRRDREPPQPPGGGLRRLRAPGGSSRLRPRSWPGPPPRAGPGRRRRAGPISEKRSRTGAPRPGAEGGGRPCPGAASTALPAPSPLRRGRPCAAGRGRHRPRAAPCGAAHRSAT